MVSAGGGRSPGARSRRGPGARGPGSGVGSVLSVPLGDGAGPARLGPRAGSPGQRPPAGGGGAPRGSPDIPGLGWFVIIIIIVINDDDDDGNRNCHSERKIIADY